MQILPLIESLKVKDLLIRGLPTKSESDDEGKADANYEALQEKDHLVRSWITGTLSEDVLYLVVGCTTAKDMGLS